jgi:ribosomal protein L11 methyltransferase
MSRNYIEVRVETGLDSGDVLALVDGPAPEGAWEADGVVHLFWSEERWSPAIVTELVGVFEQLGSPVAPEKIEVHTVPDQDWNQTWAKSLNPIRLGRRIVVRQSWNSAEVPDGGVELVIDPKRAFGTGYHATTQLLAEWLEDVVRGGERILDAGTGSGILAMVALRLGASWALGMDNDPVAIECANEYAQNNGFGGELELRVAAFDELESGAFDLVLANIDAKTLIPAAGALVRLVASGGTLLLSGLQQQDYRDITAALEGYGVRTLEMRRREEWIALLAKREFE